MENTNLPLVTIPEPVRMFTFKNDALDNNVDEFVTRTGKDLESVCEANPDVRCLFLHSITK